ncbi:MAG TPA: ABC transporter ATP-binding protein [Anaerolineae bacterium]
MQAIRKLAHFLKPYKWWAILAPLAMLLEVIMDLTQPQMIQRIIDNGVVARDSNYVLMAGGLMIVFAILGAIGGIGCTIYTFKASLGFGADLRAALFRKVQTFSFRNLDEFDTGQLVTRLTNDVSQMQDAVAALLRIMVRAPFLMIGSFILALLTAPQLSFIPLLLIPLVLAGVAWIISRAYPMYSEVQARLDSLNTVMQENLAGVRVVKAFVRASKEVERFAVANVRLTDQLISVARVTAVTFPMMMIIINAGTAAVLWFGGQLVMQGAMHIGQIIAFINYLMQMLFSLLMVSLLILQVSRAAASAQRISTVMDSAPDVQDKPAALRDFEPHGRVAFENVTFSYDGHSGDPVLKDVSFVAEPGQVVALLGTTGAGKSSLVNLIPRFYDATRGRVTIGGIDVRDVDQTQLRRHIGVALQETVLFSGTIRDNIRYGHPAATNDEVIAAAKAAQAHDFIMRMPEAYDTQLGQRGVNLSGGQKQRVAIARAILIKPAVLILDDSTSAVDVETEAEIQIALTDIMRDRTSFVIAQRISTVLTADKILVLEDGQIAAEGRHAELLANSPIYRDIYDSQLGGGANGLNGGNGHE